MTAYERVIKQRDQETEKSLIIVNLIFFATLALSGVVFAMIGASC